MKQRTRREFLRDVGTGAVVASVGSGLAADLGFSSAFADQGSIAFDDLDTVLRRQRFLRRGQHPRHAFPHPGRGREARPGVRGRHHDAAVQLAGIHEPLAVVPDWHLIHRQDRLAVRLRGLDNLASEKRKVRLGCRSGAHDSEVE